ncbi:trehalose-6-phosphate synthase [Rhodomicrobium udaipurense JA643]|uniref:Trehalose-6-phosphate synthase n=1 Tax=Rhodomicrobium udaipurense TaxID=1202716 RepID=A0A8I1GHT2_9HYPH|nr:alpha,alpha-trehalose-phosphate synthase (UDP-forming) [Rhodomicrobium udaipurense]KAI95925.1 trehalose-6-phosphate synthase [Rhodomicrobium udaipurense JA643]MBJ7543755.1 alpha,alpha-trehalose-phosphate synthase (UDP-forming) [Rhodomicrobium udaipurense]
MSRLIIVSNRVADLEAQVQSGGLAVALGDALRTVGGIWFGWDGKLVEGGEPAAVSKNENGAVTTATIPMTERDYEEYYLGFANKVLWPVCHYRLDLVHFEPGYFEGYKRVNCNFATALAPLLAPNDVVWAHDYHLISFASELRALGAKQRLGFFLHIPFPPPELLQAIPTHEWLVEALFQFDVIGFQTENDVSNFHRFIENHADGEILDDDRVRAYGRTVIARAFPIGIDVDEFANAAQTPEADSQIERLNRRTVVRSHIIGVDRLDYTKGLPERFKAFRKFLEMHPEHWKAVTLMQIAPPTRIEVEAYANIREELEGLSGAINGEFGDFDWTPLRYVHRAMPRDTLAALFRGSEVGLVTPLRDGMNLVAKEYVAAQDEEDPGVLVLSKFAGAAEELEEALIVNPYDIDDMANAMQTALRMPLEERVERHSALISRIRTHDVAFWRKSFLKVLAEGAPEVVA